jgi:predicted ATP-dependent endonuclease of OLD family
MRFTYFRFKNFKGIENQRIELSKNPNSNIYTLVGLNESGKTTILEAINFFSHKPESLDVLKIDSYKIEDIHNLIPINKRDNFNDTIEIEAGLELSEDDLNEVKKEFANNGFAIKECSKKVTYTQIYHFKNSVHQSEEDESLWNYWVKGKKKEEIEFRSLTNDENQIANKNVIKPRIPSILYFPNFLFEFPEKIYLDKNISDEKHIFYQTIIQDVLDSLKNNTNIKEHLISRIKSDEKNEKRNLNSLLGKMEKQLSNVIFDFWNDIFQKKINDKEIVLLADSDDNGPYIEFNIKDDVDTYRINERSLGFRWFFVYILLTQFRSYRKKNNNAFFLFDEPASNLHPSAQQELLKSFNNLPNVLYTTHSHYLINPIWLENTYVVRNKGIDYENEADSSAKNTDISIMKYREFASRFPSQTSYFQPILEILEYRPANLELVPKVVLTEGKNDYYTFNYYQLTIKDYKYPLKIVPGVSSNNLTNLISLYLGWGTKFIVLLDSDKAGLKEQKRYFELFGESVIGSIITYLDIDSRWNNFETENLFTEADKIKIQTNDYLDKITYDKKQFNRCILEQHLANTKISLSDETHKNFKLVLDFLKDKLK